MIGENLGMSVGLLRPRLAFHRPVCEVSGVLFDVCRVAGTQEANYPQDCRLAAKVAKTEEEDS